jgi:hypothetical protein
MLHRRRTPLGAACAALALLAAGCGSSSSGGDRAAAAPAPAAKTQAAAPAAAAPAATPSGAAAPTRAAYIHRADQVCLLARGVSRRANEVVSKAFNSGSSSRAADAIDSYMPLFTQHLQELKAIKRPQAAQDQPILDGLIKVMDSQVQALADESKALRQQDPDAMAQISKAQQQEVQFAEDLGRQYGFKVCGRAA